jgi:sugar phosphate isomerase/epimerase
MHMKLGMPTLVEFLRFEDNLVLCRKLGLELVEIHMDLPTCLPETMSPYKLRDLANEYGIEFSVHLPEELDLASHHPSIRKGHQDRFRETIDWAASAGIRKLNMHLHNGIYFTLPDRKVWIYERNEPGFIKLLIESFTRLNEWAGMYGLTICIENTGNFQMPFIGRALHLLLSSFDHVHLTWDVGHDAKSGFAEESFFVKNVDRIRHMHLHDYVDGKDHQPLFSGIVPIRDRLAIANRNDASVIVEVKTSESLERSVTALKDAGLA